MVCSCGRKGLSAGPALPSSADMVPRMAALTPDAKRSPMMRINGPVICGGRGERFQKRCFHQLRADMAGQLWRSKRSCRQWCESVGL